MTRSVTSANYQTTALAAAADCCATAILPACAAFFVRKLYAQDVVLLHHACRYKQLHAMSPSSPLAAAQLLRLQALTTSKSMRNTCKTSCPRLWQRCSSTAA
jgi:hypothetical protein